MARKPKVKLTPEWIALKRKLGDLDKARVHVGVLASGKGSDKAEGGDGITMLEIAAIHEFGSPAAHIPERSFIRRTFEEQREELAKIQVEVAKRLVNIKQFTVATALKIIGAWGAAAIQRTIGTGPPIPPPLAPATIARRKNKSNRPLLNNGQLRASITWEIKEK